MQSQFTVLSARPSPASGGGERLTLTVREAAHQLGVSVSYYYREAKHGRLPAKRIGRRLVVPKAALIEFLNADFRNAPSGERATAARQGGGVA